MQRTIIPRAFRLSGLFQAAVNVSDLIRDVAGYWGIVDGAKIGHCLCSGSRVGSELQPGLRDRACQFQPVACPPERSFDSVVFRAAVSTWLHPMGTLHPICGSADPLGLALAPYQRLPVSKPF